MSILDFFKSLGKRGIANKQTEQPNQTPAQENEQIKPEERFILCIDGGGMRGVIPSVYLKHLEAAIQRQGGNNSLDSYFDLIAGTSTGGLIVLALTCPSAFSYKLCDNAPQVELDEILEQYRTIGKEIFPTSSFNDIRHITSTKYPGTGIEKVLKDWFADSLMGQATVPTLIMSYDLFNGTPFEIRSYEERSFLVRDAGRATSAAPTYFPPLIKEGKILVDGGVVANNPALYAYLEAKKLYPNCTKYNILSFSTGDKNHTMTLEETNGLWSWKHNVVPMYSTAQKCTTDTVLNNMKDVNYMRIDDALKVKFKMDDSSPTSMKEMEEFAQEVAKNHEKEFNEFATAMIKASQVNASQVKTPQ